jgi:hypothetical protein
MMNDTSAESNMDGDHVSIDCLEANEGSLDPLGVHGGGCRETRITSGATVTYSTRSKRLHEEPESHEPPAELPGNVAVYKRTVRPVGKLPPRLMAAQLVVNNAGSSRDQGVIGVPEPGAIELIAAVHKRPLHELVSRWCSLRQHGLGTAFFFRYQGRFTRVVSV